MSAVLSDLILFIMRKISLNVLLRFLRKYSHWNLVRRSDGYHLFFLAQQPGDKKINSAKNGKTISRKNKKSASVTVTTNKIRRNTNQGKHQSKDVFVFNPIFNNIEDGVSLGLDSAVERSRRSSLSSFIWDDFLPTYNKESDEEAFRGNQSESDSSGRSTPVQSTQPYSDLMEPSQVKERFYEASMLQQGDRLLKEMLQLRKDLEKEKNYFDFTVEDKEKNNNSFLPDYGPLEHNEENILREKLEMMTQQIKREMEEQFNQKNSETKSSEDERSKMLNIFRSLFHDTKDEAEGKDGKTKKETLKSAINNLLEMNEETSETFEEAKKQFDRENKKEKTKKSTTKKSKKEEKQIVEVPFCSHTKATNIQAEEENPVTEDDDTEDSKKVLLTPDEQIAAEEILKELLDIRNTGNKQKDPVLDSMISIIQLSSTNVSLPTQSSNGSGIQFKDLFNFEVNFSESKEAFAKLSLSGDRNVSLQELFPWTLNHSQNKQYHRLKASDSWL